MNMEPYQISLIIAFVLGIAEVMMGAFIFLGLAIGGLAVAAIQWISGEFSLNRDLVIFAGVAALAVVSLRKVFAKPDDQETTDKDVNQY
jgi:membrane protein implicated in regulation of membrane protease activity